MAAQALSVISYYSLRSILFFTPAASLGDLFPLFSLFLSAFHYFGQLCLASSTDVAHKAHSVNLEQSGCISHHRRRSRRRRGAPFIDSQRRGELR